MSLAEVAPFDDKFGAEVHFVEARQCVSERKVAHQPVLQRSVTEKRAGGRNSEGWKAEYDEIDEE